MTVDHVTGGAVSAEFAAMLSRAASVAGYDVPPPDRVTRYLERECGPGSNAGALFCVKRGGELQAGIVVLRAGSSLVYQWGARAHPLESADVPLAHALHWEAICWGRARGFERYDFGGLTGADECDGIDRFKQSFGGERQRMFGEALHARGFWGHVTSGGTGRLLARLWGAAASGRARFASHA
jgi:CelD/BcsL family acetyltransferase involved in cellulose biosynthesis